MSKYNKLPFCDVNDETHKDVHLIYGITDIKLTAEDCGDEWMIVHWYLIPIPGSHAWTTGNIYRIDKRTVKNLGELR